MTTYPAGAQQTNDADPDAVKYATGPVTGYLGRAKPENSTRPRDGNIKASVFDGPFGGKKPQS